MKYKLITILTLLLILVTTSSPAQAVLVDHASVGGVYSAQAGGIANFVPDSYNWMVNRSLWFDRNGGGVAPDEYYLSALVPAIRSPDLPEPFFPFYHHLVEDPAVSSYTLGTPTETAGAYQEVKQYINTNEIEVEITLRIYNHTRIYFGVNIIAQIGLSNVEIILYIAPDFSPGTLETALTESYGSSNLVWVNGSSQYLVAESTGEAALVPWGDGPGDLTSDDGISGILNGEGANSLTSASGDLDIRFHGQATTLAVNEQLALDVELGVSDDLAELRAKYAGPPPTSVPTTSDPGTTSSSPTTTSATVTTTSNPVTTTSTPTTTSTTSTTSNQPTSTSKPPTSESGDSDGGFLPVAMLPITASLVVVSKYYRRT